MARYYRAGGGLLTNVSAGSIDQILAGVLAKSITNPRAAEGGADGELPEAVLDRGPLLVRNRMQALSADDYEAVAREASPAIAVARALPATHPTGRFAPGWVKLVIMPHSHDAKPQPSFQLRRLVHNFVSARMPASIAGQLHVVGPDYLEVGVVAVVAPANIQHAGPVLQDVTTTLQSFLNPLRGGPDGKGWPFGRDVYLSDVAAIVEAIAGVDYIATLELTLGGTPHGEVVQVPEDRIVVAGPLRVTFAGGEG
jgi:predicted phage baseplate assembly protein